MLGQHDYFGVPGDMHGWVEHRGAHRSIGPGRSAYEPPTCALNAPERVTSMGMLGGFHPEKSAIRCDRNGGRPPVGRRSARLRQRRGGAGPVASPARSWPRSPRSSPRSRGSKMGSDLRSRLGESNPRPTHYECHLPCPPWWLPGISVGREFPSIGGMRHGVTAVRVTTCVIDAGLYQGSEDHPLGPSHRTTPSSRSAAVAEKPGCVQGRGVRLPAGGAAWRRGWGRPPGDPSSASVLEGGDAVAASNSLKDVSGWLDERLAAARPDLLWTMVK